jgi:UrcA family protein
MENIMNRYARITLMVLAVGLMMPGAGAQENADKTLTVGKTTVEYGDLNLAAPSDAAAMYERLDHAVVRSCGRSLMFQTHYNENPFAKTAKYKRCYRAAMTNAIQTLQAPEVARMWKDAEDQ